ncbi:MAG: Sec-dependent nitrous-oxide reductase [Candidatus Latescibacteria bacterium]|nr:Sec-dependent nitrous-oxide reductase [Candidatus Latescibacterota bacterium]NIM22706.1 Sec-dependent nitrous-oxide reductase [Candidatus Latescibacterota bacterium]NIM64995.1 Sec-dependent nitrous-oxide reductase [Candidatus Latescibacterota bacterium]NIO01510.1 Sec-dependent nitrous-oxide reductase [Candidatus Latescibacterota bacterium]NIO28019.1 Sec-dependent nitrous-oxide reductase [Candidatus Latescibacterota bacterium]
MKMLLRPLGLIPVLLIVLAMMFIGCGKQPPERGARRGAGIGASDRAAAALATYVAPGDLDEYYLFYSGGHSGQVFVAGVPSMRHICTIPVFTPYPGTGYGFDDESGEMLGGYTWGDSHHPGFSETNGEYDGRWLFINDNANGRIARIDLADFKTKQILKVPNISANHGSSFITPNSEYATMATRMSVPFPEGTYADVTEYATKYKGVVAGIKIDPKTGHMSLGWEIVVPPLDYDLGDAGKGPSEGYLFWTCYNSEREFIEGGKLEVTASQRDKDYILMVDWRAAEKAVADGQASTVKGAPVLYPDKSPGICYYIPLAKSPHGVDVAPSGQWIIGSGKLSPTTTVFDIEKIKKAIAEKDFEDTVDGIPVLTYTSVREAEIPVGLGPLHTQFDGKGYAYTSLFVESAVAKWKLPPYDDPSDMSQYVVDKIPVSYNIGHLVSAEGDSRSPDGNYLVALNKLSKGRHLSVGPSIPESAQLIDITGDKMKLLYDAFTEPEPHYAVIIKADKINAVEVYKKDDTRWSKNPNAIWSAEEAKIERRGNTVEVWMMAVRSFFAPDVIRVNKGDKVIVHVTNIEQTRDELHGFAIDDYNINIVIDPGETKTVTFAAEKGGVHAFYCTNFCSALHQEMQGYLLVK